MSSERGDAELSESSRVKEIAKEMREIWPDQ